MVEMETNWRMTSAASARSRRHADWAPEVLEARRGGPAERLAGAFGSLHPALVFIVTMLVGFFLIIGLSICAGLLVTHVLDGLQGERVDIWLAHHRTPARTDASLVGSIVAGGVVLP